MELNRGKPTSTNTKSGIYIGHYIVWIAFQVILPKVSRFWVTIMAGGIATMAGLFPAFAMKLLGFVALYGFVLAPVDVIIVFEHLFARKLGIQIFYEERSGIQFNRVVTLACVINVAGFYFVFIQYDIFLSFVTLPI